MRPGITGLAQVKGRNNISWPKRIKYDIEYVKRFNILLDIKIILETVLIVLKRDGTGVKSEYRAAQTLSEVKHAMKIDYFENDNLLKM